MVVAILMLWTGPARDWFAGRPVRELPARGKPEKPANRGTWETTMPRDADRLHQPDQPEPPQGARRRSGATDRPTGRLTGTPPRPAHPTRVPAHDLGFLHPAPGHDRVRDASGSGRPTALQRRRGDAGRHDSGPMAPGQMATWNADPSAVPVPVKIACVAHLGLLRRWSP